MLALCLMTNWPLLMAIPGLLLPATLPPNFVDIWFFAFTILLIFDLLFYVMFDNQVFNLCPLDSKMYM